MNELDFNNFIDYVHRNTTGELAESLGLLQKAKKKGYVCPECKNGTGKDGDGISLNPKKPGRFHCFKCNANFDLIDLVKTEYGLNERDAIKRTADLMNYNLDFKTNKKVEPTKQPDQPKQTTNNDNTEAEKPVDEKVIKALEAKDGIFKSFLVEAHERLLKSEPGLEYLKKRGISLELAKRAFLGYVENYKYEYIDKNTNEKKSYTIKQGIIRPGSYDSFVIRNITPNINKSDRYRKPSNDIYPEAIDMPTGLKEVISEPEKRNKQIGIYEPIFLVEGYFDALSFNEIGADAISLNGVGNADRIIDAFKEFNVKRPIILAMDNDKAGEQSQFNLNDQLKRAKMEVFQVDREEFYQDKKDANKYLTDDREGFKQAVFNAKFLVSAKFDENLNFKQIDKFNEYLEDTLKHPPIPTGFEKLDSTDFLDGGLYPGLYILGANSALGKTSFVLQIADNIAKNGTPVLYISLEMLGHELRARSISRYTYIKTLEEHWLESEAKTVRGILNKNRYKNYTPSELELITESKKEYFIDTGANLMIVESVGETTTDEIIGYIDGFIKYRGEAPVVFIDYLQILGRPNDQKYSMQDKQIIDVNVHRLKQISRDYNLPMVIISSFNRDSYGAPPTMASFKESGIIEYTADVLITLEPNYIITDPMYNERSKNDRERIRAWAIKYARYINETTGNKGVKLKVQKNRNGKSDIDITYNFKSMFNYYYELNDVELMIQREEAKAFYEENDFIIEAKNDKKDKKDKKPKKKNPNTVKKGSGISERHREMLGLTD